MPSAAPDLQRVNSQERQRLLTMRRVEWDLNRKQRWWPFGWFRVCKYTIPEHLHQKIMDGRSSSMPRTAFKQRTSLLRYHRRLSGNKKGTLLNLCALQTVADGHTLGYSDSGEKKVSVAESLDRFQQELSKYRDRPLTICAINVNTEKQFEHLVSTGLLGWLSDFNYNGMPDPWADKQQRSTQQVGLSSSSDGSSTYRKPSLQDLFEIMFKEHWTDCAKKITKVIQETRSAFESPPHSAWVLNFPSKAFQVDAGKQSTSSSTLSPNALDFQLKWMGEPPQLETFLGLHDWNIYIYQPYAERPKLEILHYVSMPDGASFGGRSVVATTSHRVLARLKDNIDAAVNDKTIDMSSSNVEDVIYGFIVAFLKSVLSDVTDNFLLSVTRTQELDMISRQNPSLSKVQYLLHLNECHRLAAGACRHNALVVPNLFQQSPNASSPDPRSKQLRKYADDFAYLAEELEKHASQISELKQVVVEQIDLFDKRRSRVIRVFIAIYVPLAFATSFFGMNIQDNSAFTFWSNSTVTTRPSSGAETTNSTYSETQLFTDQPGSVSWPLWMFGAVAAALTFASVILPLIAGRMFRHVARFSIRRRHEFRVIVSAFVMFLNPWVAGCGSFLLGAIVGVIALFVNRKRGLPAQATAWFLWSCLCVLSAVFDLVRRFVPDLSSASDTAMFVFTVLTWWFGWFYVLLNWITAPTTQDLPSTLSQVARFSHTRQQARKSGLQVAAEVPPNLGRQRNFTSRHSLSTIHIGEIPRYIDEKIIEASKLDSDHLRPYHNALSKKTTGEGLDRCVWLSGADGHVLHHPAENSVAQDLDRFQHELALTASRKFTVCAINFNTERDFEPLVLQSYSQQIFRSHSYYRYKNRKYKSGFQGLLEIIFRHRWPECADIIANVTSETRARSPPQLSQSLKLPSRSRNALNTEQETPHFRGIDLELEWMSEFPRLERFLGFTTLYIYIFQPYTSRPSLNVLRLVDLTPTDPTSCQVLAATSSHGVLQHFKHSFDATVDAKIIDPLSMGIDDLGYGSLSAFVKVILSDVQDYLLDSIAQIQKLDMASRRSPSSYDVQYLLHFRECHDWAAGACRANAKIISGLIDSPLPVPSHVSLFLEAFTGYIEDFEYLAEELDRHACQICDLKDAIIEQYELADKRRSRVIGLYVALYVPLAFATSFFGMNIVSNPGTSVWTNSTSTLGNSSHVNDSSSSSAQILASSDEPGGQLWPMYLFGLVAVALTIANVIPFIAGLVFRGVARFSIHHREAFRFITGMALGIGGFMLSIYVVRSFMAYCGIAVGIIGLRVNSGHHRWGQVVGWVGFMSICIVVAIVANVSSKSSYWPDFGLSIIWGLLLGHWIIAPVGRSWFLF
ncbi:hypothetical protein Q7P37_000379 [Cladosporium fusiforme]